MIRDTSDIHQHGLTDWKDYPPMTYVDVKGRERKKRDGPEWGLGPYRGEYVRNHHINRGMFALRPSKKQRTTYTWGKMTEHVYSDQVDRLVKIIKVRIHQDQQVIIHIGDANGNGTGSGKSTLGLQLACDIQRQMDRSFILGRDLVLDANNFMGRVRYGGQNGILLMDEQHEILGQNKASEKGAKFLRACFASLRSRHNVIIMVSPRLSGLTTVVESELVDIRIDCSNPQSSWLPNIGRGLFQCFIAQRTQKFGRANRTEIPFWKLIFTGIFHPKMLPHGLWEEYMVFKNKFQDMMLDKSIRKVEEDDEDALAYIKEVYGLKEIVPTEIDRMVKAISEEPAPKMKRGRGRPKGAKDSYKRVRKRKQSNKSAQGAHRTNPTITDEEAQE